MAVAVLKHCSCGDVPTIGRLLAVAAEKSIFTGVPEVSVLLSALTFFKLSFW